MFGKMMKNYYYGKSGKGDYTKDDLPKNRWQLFWEMLRVRLSGLCRLNLMTIAAWLPLLIVMFSIATSVLGIMNANAVYLNYYKQGVTELPEGYSQESMELLDQQINALIESSEVISQAENPVEAAVSLAEGELMRSYLMRLLLWLIPCIAVTGPAQAGMAYVTRNWSRDEHAFIWSDFKDAVKENWKQALGVSAITSVIPLIVYVCYQFYGDKVDSSLLFIVPQMLTLTVGLVWMLGVTFMYPMMVSYKVTFRQLVKNSLMLAVGRLPQTVGVRLALLLPAALLVLIGVMTDSLLLFLLIAGYYIVLGNALARFVIASYTNGVFDRYINSRLEGVPVNRGLAVSADDEDEEEDEEEEGKNAPEA